MMASKKIARDITHLNSLRSSGVKFACFVYLLLFFVPKTGITDVSVILGTIPSTCNFSNDVMS